MENNNSDNVLVIDIESNNNISVTNGQNTITSDSNDSNDSEELILNCFRVGDLSSKAFIIRVNLNQQIFNIKEEISKAFKPRIVPRHIRIYTIVDELTPESRYLASIKHFKEAKSSGKLNLIELNKPLKRIIDEPTLYKQLLKKEKPDNLDILIVDDDLQKSIDNIVSCNSIKSAGSNDSRERIISRDSSKFKMEMENVEKKFHIKNKKLRLALILLAIIITIVIIIFIWFPNPFFKN